MATENHEMSNGWPLGLQIMSMRLRLQERLQASAAPVVEPYSLHIPSTSFSSFSSSNLDTESTASFFQDNSVSLGKLIGFRPHDRAIYFCSEENNGNSRLPVTAAAGGCKDMSRTHRAYISEGICIPLILGALVKISRNRGKSKRLDV